MAYLLLYLTAFPFDNSTGYFLAFILILLFTEFSKSILSLSASLITYIIIASWSFYAMSCAAVIILRKKRPEMKRPYKTPGYPYIPIIFILFSVFLTINTILEAPRDAAVGAGIILAGLPLYLYWKNND